MLPDPAAARQSVEQIRKRTLPILLGMDAVDGTPLSDKVGGRAVEASFDALAQIGNDRAAGRGVFVADGESRVAFPGAAALYRWLHAGIGGDHEANPMLSVSRALRHQRDALRILSSK